MFNHFEALLNTKSLLERFKPNLVVEAGCGLSTAQLEKLQETQPFSLVLMDQVFEVWNGVLGHGTGFRQLRKDVTVLPGVSYLNFELFPDGAIDFAIVDTDHNGWTLEKELSVLERKVKPGGVVVLHDTETFGDVQGTMPYYLGHPVPYPLREILNGPTMRQVVDVYRTRWTVLAESKEEHGAIAFQLPEGQ
jgi:hypothetical protein